MKSPAVRNTIAGTCSHVRNLSLRKIAGLFESRKHFKFEMNNLCFGRGWRMARGHLVSLGACTAGWTNTHKDVVPKPGFVPIKDPAKALLPDGAPMRFQESPRDSLPRSKFANKL
jgi:hypothetical protein